MGGAKAMILFTTKNPNLFVWGGGGGGAEGGREGGEGPRVSDCFFTKNPNRILKKNVFFLLFFFLDGGGWELGGGGAGESEFFYC